MIAGCSTELLSARRFFHVRYIGRDIHRNEKREPSVVLAELLDYCRHGYALPDNWLVTASVAAVQCHVFSRTEDKERLQLARLLSFNRQAWQVAAAWQRQSVDIFDREFALASLMTMSVMTMSARQRFRR